MLNYLSLGQAANVALTFLYLDFQAYSRNFTGPFFIVHLGKVATYHSYPYNLSSL